MLTKDAEERTDQGPDEGGLASGSIDKAGLVLQALAQRPDEGLRLSEVAAGTGLGKTTTHRLLASLGQIGFVEQDPETRLYRLGFELFCLGMAAANRFGIIEQARPCLDRLAEETGDTVFLSVRDRHEAICVDRRVGDFPIKTLTLNVGDRRPLGVGAGSMALLAFLSDEEVERAIAANAPRLAELPGFEPLAVRQSVQAIRAQGYSLNDGRIIPDMFAIGMPILGRRGQVAGALSVAAIASRMQPPRREMIVAALQREAAFLRDRLDPPARDVARDGGKGREKA